MDEFHITLVVIIFAMVMLGSGFSRRDTPLGLFLMWVGVLAMLSLVSYRIYLATTV